MSEAPPGPAEDVDDELDALRAKADLKAYEADADAEEVIEERPDEEEAHAHAAGSSSASPYGSKPTRTLLARQPSHHLSPSRRATPRSQCADRTDVRLALWLAGGTAPVALPGGRTGTGG